MELDSNEVVKKIEEYRKDYSCSQATLMGICEVAGMPTEELALLAKGFSGGNSSRTDSRSPRAPSSPSRRIIEK